MSNTITFLKRAYLLILFVFSTFCLHAQPAGLSLQLTATHETCPGNGRLDFTVSNTTVGSTVIFTVYKLPNITTPIVTTQANTFTGLVAGNYRVIATESLPNGSSTTRQRDAIILDQKVALQASFQATNQSCVHAGSITVEVTSGYPETYQIIAGPTTTSPQSSNVFPGLTSGVYTVKVVDICGEFIQQNVTVTYVASSLGFAENTTTTVSCDVLQLNHSVSAITGEINYPITVQYTFYGPGSTTSVSTQVINSGHPDTLALTQQVPFAYGQSYPYTITVSNSCGGSLSSSTSNFVLNPVMHADANTEIVNCNQKRAIIDINEFGVAPFTVTFLSAPLGFNPSLYNSSHPNFNEHEIIYYNPSVPLPVGTYQLKVTDSCGRTALTSFAIDNVFPIPNLTVSELKGCAEGFTTLSIITNSIFNPIVSAILEQAPATYTTALPLNLSSNVVGYQLFMVNLTTGLYTFKITDSCGNIHHISSNVVGYHTISNNFQVIESCTSFAVNLQNVSNIPDSLTTFWLQKLNPATNQWGHPITGNSASGLVGSLSAINLQNNALNPAVQATGKFRILKLVYTYRVPTVSDPSTINYCTEEIGTFDFLSEPRIINIYSVSCGVNAYQVIVEAEGVGPLRYEIVSKNGTPFYLGNGTSSIFDNLEPAVYLFRVTDVCGNIKSRLFEVSGNVVFSISATPFCNGSVAALSVPNFPYLQYTWWKDNNTAAVLSASNVLNFNSFNLANDAGIYHVRITNPGNPNTCIDFEKTYTIVTALSNPNAGNDGQTKICGTHGIIDLNTLLSANHDGNGSWIETSNSAIPIVNGTWDSTTVSDGIYIFNYKINGLCGNNDVAIITIHLKSSPPSATAFADSEVCTLGTLHLYATTVSGAQYLWAGPNGFTSNEQNPILSPVAFSMAGTYTVRAIIDGCESAPSSATVTVNDFPEFSLKTYCELSKKIGVRFLDAAIHPEWFNYTYIYPDGSMHSGTQDMDMNGQQTGNYTVLVTNQNGCEISKQILIKCSICDIPKGVSANGDDQNDSFDLQCLDDVQNVKIYNRYGVLLFDQDKYLNEWKGYDKNGHLLPTATYYYLITFGSGETKAGWVYLNY